MTLRAKTVYIFSAAMCFLVGVVFFLTDHILRQRSEMIEQQLVRDDVNHARDALFDEIAGIDIFTVDWSAWDETYAFARTHNPEFVERNLSHGELFKQRKSFVVFADASGAIIYSQGLTLSYDGEAPVLESLLKAIASTDALVIHNGIESAVNGIVAVPECVVLITSRPILTGDYKGPVAGAFIVGKYLSPTHINVLARQTHLSIAIDNITVAALDQGVQALEYIAVQVDGPNQITGRTLLMDINGRPCAVLSVRAPRVLYKQYLHSLQYFVGAFLVVALLTGVIMFLFTERIILSRLSRLFAFIRGIQSTEKLSDRIMLGGRDEIAAIGAGVNEMLEKLARDVARSAHAEQALQASEERYRNIFEAFMDVYYRIDASGIIIDLSPSIQNLSGWAAEELIGRHVTSVYHDPSEYERLVAMLADQGSVYDFEITLMNKNGNLLPVSVCCHVCWDTHGRFNGDEGSIRDITERKRTEEKIRQQYVELETAHRTLQSETCERERFAAELLETERQLANLIETSEDSIIVSDGDGRLIRANQAFLNMLGYGLEEVLGRHVTFFFVNTAGVYEMTGGEKVIINETFITEQAEVINRFMREGRGSNWKTYYRNKEEKIIPVVQSLVFLTNDHGVYTASFGIIRDITEQLQAEAELTKAKNVAEQASKVKSEFLANMSHEIRTPLNGIIGMTEVIFDTRLDDNQWNILSTISTEVNALHGIINDILDFSKIEAGKLEFDSIPFDLRVAVEDVAASLAARAYQKGLELDCFISPGIPPHLIGDPGRLKQILRNLAENALKFTHAGEIDISADLAEDTGKAIVVRFAVKDTGIGIPKDKQSIIFENFTQVDSSTTRKYGGTGLGTSIAKQLVEMMGGEIDLKSRPGKGTTFFFTAVFEKQVAPKAALSLCKAADPEGKRVLVVDDNWTSRHILTEYLKSWGCRTAEATGGREALGKLSQACLSANAFDLVLMDMQMPDMDGFDTSREIRRTPGIEDIPIVILTAGGRRGDGLDCKKLGIRGYLTKPVRRNELYDVCVTVMGDCRDSFCAVPQIITRYALAENNRRNVQILLAEDYPSSQQAVMQQLQSAGCGIDLASDGREALAAARLKQYDLIFMDVQMPEMDGFEATAGIRAHETKISTPGNAVHVPIIAMTAHAMKGYRELCLERGMDDYIAKPARKKDVLAMVETWTGNGTLCHLCHIPALTQSSDVDSPPERAVPMDYDRALEEYDGNREFLMELVNGFLERASQQIETLWQSLADGNAEIVMKEAHAMKGGAGILTAVALSGVALELETIGKSGNLTAGAEVLSKLEHELQRLADFVNSVIRGNHENIDC